MEGEGQFIQAFVDCASGWRDALARSKFDIIPYRGRIVVRLHPDGCKMRRDRIRGRQIESRRPTSTVVLLLPGCLCRNAAGRDTSRKHRSCLPVSAERVGVTG